MKKEIINNTLSIMIDGMEIRTKEQLLTTMKEAFSFPDYFGMNWDALDEVLKDLSWLEGVESIHIVFENSSRILSSSNESDKLKFRNLIDSSVNYWDDNKEIRFSLEYK